ncbi:tripeptidyl-peptidase II Tpp2 [Coemansia sp. RSA 1286]|nr:tripeptidyl-peptidase II Tpp2 [Coemansia sp. RSA 1286]
MLPKGLTQVDEFLSKNPTFDGRDTVVAILDTGIDPAAIGMQTTSTGKPKVVDFIDCTGIGDVQMEPAQKCSDKNPLELVGASGRTLKLNPNWKNPSGDWYVGSKSLYSIAPAEVTGELAAFDPEEPVYMGIAPGAQILSLSVGDKRTGMMETGIGLIRAVNAIIEYNVDVANMSYGEPSSTSNEARVDRLLTVAEA